VAKLSALASIPGVGDLFFFKLIFYSANSQAIERTFKSALEKRLGTTFRMIS
jgi:hypothetical protein